MQNVITTIFMPFLVATAKSLLLSLAQNVWDSLWDLVFESVGEIEIHMKDKKNQENKKQIVLNRIDYFLSKEKKLKKNTKMGSNDIHVAHYRQDDIRFE
jgi:hypothetical protein